jgi:hypothetical protein
MDRSILKFTIWNKNISSLISYLNSESFKFEFESWSLKNIIWVWNLIFEFWKVRFQFRKFVIKAIINEIVRKLINDKITSH